MSIGPNQETDRIATALFAAIEAVDLDAVRALYAPEVAIWHNVTNRTQTREENLRLLANFTSRVHQLHYEILARDFFTGGFVQRHVLHGKLASGESLEVPVCLVVHVSGGAIQRLFEYLDGAAVQPAF